MIAAHGGADIVDIRSIAEGSPGAGSPRVIRETIRAVSRPGTVFSATLGDLPHTPGTAELAGLGVDVVGGRGVVCGGNDRSTGIDLRKVDTFHAEARQLSDPAQAVEDGGRLL
ncbi:(5-formylfuran-3-yl)methyl phosphate synthase [Streptomyces uncialis]|uniref:(5-formylfuran-3-yl)methyl phosphate synthase n=1 Tax=Streptomyces uncialis TaxID=1048205 RepID=UPI00386C327A|nr:hypothetical protein OG924_29765 [Streptomyces uncialis]